MIISETNIDIGGGRSIFKRNNNCKIINKDDTSKSISVSEYEKLKRNARYSSTDHSKSKLDTYKYDNQSIKKSLVLSTESFTDAINDFKDYLNSNNQQELDVDIINSKIDELSELLRELKRLNNPKGIHHRYK